jgi:chromosome segregation ATPase
VRTELLRPEVIEILPLDTENLSVYVKIPNVPPSIRDALSQIIRLKQAVATTQQQLDARRRQISDINVEQSRIRENMRAVANTTDYYTRLIKKLDEQETTIEQLQKGVTDLSKQLDAQRKELDQKVGALTIS